MEAALTGVGQGGGFRNSRVAKTARSLFLAVILLGVLAAGCILSTLVPQGMDAAAYSRLYPGMLGDLIVRSGFSRYFSSALFLVPAGLLFLNLSACTISRLSAELAKKEKRRFGPAILHVGLMALLLTGSLSAVLRAEGSVSLAPGESVALPGGGRLALLAFSTDAFPDGRVRGWTSRVRITDADGTVAIDSREIMVNRPLRIDGVTLYQHSFGSRRLLLIRDPDGVEHSLGPGQELVRGDAAVLYMGEDAEARESILRFRDSKGTRVLRARPGSGAGVFLVVGSEEAETSGILAVKDSGYPFVVLSFAIIALGLGLTSFRKIGDLHELDS